MDTVSVIIPAYNEEAHIGECIRETLQALNGIPCEVIVVDDGSKDGTRSMALSAAEGNSCVKVVGYEANQGKGNALKLGFGHATGNVIAFLDADMQIHPCQLLSLYKEMMITGADVVIGCKRHAQSRVDYSLFRQIVSMGYLILTRWLFGLHLRDTQTGIKLFRDEVLQRVWPRISTKRFAFDLALLVGAMRYNYRVVEAPVEISPAKGKRDRIGIGAIARTLIDTLIVFYEASFWKWLSPGLSVRVWMVGFALGLIAFSFGLAHLLTFVQLPKVAMEVSYYITMQFMDKRVRDWVLITFGVVVMILAVVQLNKSVLDAFARADSGDLASIGRATEPQPTAKERRETRDAPCKI